ncbi:SPOR domain-containing protein [Saccharicrinis sp. FJH62]|uniref:SPOR domain-containing protein n=1 Tax=Saccharicrinis sp. FJH62 TaxID=3344657 RepID=UPI0035D4C4BB
MQLKQAVFQLIIIVSLSFFSSLKAQTKLSDEAEEMYRTENYREAAFLYKEILKSFPTNAIYNHRYGVSVYEINGDLDVAKKHLEFAAKKGIRLSGFYLAKIYFKQYEFDKAIEYYNQFKAYIRNSDPRQEEIKKGIAQCEEGKEMLQRVEDIQVTDTLVVPFELFFKHYDISHETGSFSNILPNDSVAKDSLYLLYLPEKADRSFYDEFVNATEKRNLFRKDKLLDAWSEPKAIDAINTTYNEIFPFLMSDGLTMYFCSDRPESFGGYDIFVTRYNPSINDFLPPQPIGMPFNSYGNDYLYVIDEFKNTGWFASDRHNKAGFVTIYKFVPNPTKKFLNTTDIDKLRSAALIHEVKSNTGELSGTPDTEDTTYDAVVPEDMEDIGMIDIQGPRQREFTFIINDTTVYKKMSDFKNRDALTTFKTYLNFKDKTDSLSDAITNYRIKYESEGNEAQRSSLTGKILNAEEMLQNYQSKVDSLEQRTRKLEIDALKAYTKMINEDEAYLAPWKPEPLEIDIPKNIIPSFYNPYLKQNYKDIFTPAEIERLKDVEKDKLTADNLVLDWQEILMKLNKDPNADRIIVEKLIERDSAFAEPMTREQLAKISDQMRQESTDYYFKALTGKYDILKNKNLFLARMTPDAATQKAMKKLQQDAEFSYYNASMKTQNFTDYQYLNFDEVQQTTGNLESSIDLLEREIITYDKAKKTAVKPAPEMVAEKVPVKDSIGHVITYKVQIGIFKNKPNASALSKIPQVTTETIDGALIRYYSGEYNTKEEAEAEAKTIEASGFPGAFVVPFINGKKSTWEDIQKLNSK